MDLPSSGNIEVENSASPRDPPREVNVAELLEYLKRTSEGLSLDDLARLGRSGLEDGVFKAFPQLSEADPRDMAVACEYLQASLFMREAVGSSGIGLRGRRTQKLDFFRLAQKIRDDHGTKRENSPPSCFQSFEDIEELERHIEINNCVGFMIHCIRLDLVDVGYMLQIFDITCTVEQLVAVYDESVSMLERSTRHPIERFNYGAGELAQTFLSRGASLYHRDQHGVSSPRRLLGLGDSYIEHEPLRTLLTYICCPLKYVGAEVIADNRRLAPLSCLAARRIPPSTPKEHLSSELRPFVRSHWELREMFAGNMRYPEPLDGWRREDYPLDSDD